MKNIKQFELFNEIANRKCTKGFSYSESNKIKTQSICKKYGIKNYTINSDGSININGNFNLPNIGFDKLPLKFRYINGDFDCSYNQLTSLEGCPEKIKGDFDCTFNKLTSLEGCPKHVNSFFCHNNFLISLKGCPSSLTGCFYCDNNQLTSLEGCPESVDSFNCTNNQITSFDGFPKHIADDLYCHGNPIYNIWKLFMDYSKMEFFQDCDPVRDDKVIILERLNYFLEEIGKPSVKLVEGYKCI